VQPSVYRTVLSNTGTSTGSADVASPPYGDGRCRDTGSVRPGFPPADADPRRLWPLAPGVARASRGPHASPASRERTAGASQSSTGGDRTGEHGRTDRSRAPRRVPSAPRRRTGAGAVAGDDRGGRTTRDGTTSERRRPASRPTSRRRANTGERSGARTPSPTCAGAPSRSVTPRPTWAGTQRPLAGALVDRCRSVRAGEGGSIGLAGDGRIVDTSVVLGARLVDGRFEVLRERVIESIS
jgi:hypothetical protein